MSCWLTCSDTIHSFLKGWRQHVFVLHHTITQPVATSQMEPASAGFQENQQTPSSSHADELQQLLLSTGHIVRSYLYADHLSQLQRLRISKRTMGIRGMTCKLMHHR